MSVIAYPLTQMWLVWIDGEKGERKWRWLSHAKNKRYYTVVKVAK